jgi:hypothetical protein
MCIWPGADTHLDFWTLGELYHFYSFTVLNQLAVPFEVYPCLSDLKLLSRRTSILACFNELSIKDI